MDVHKLIQFFSDFIYIYILLYVTLSVKVLKKSMVFLNPLTLDNVTYRRVDEIRKNMDRFLHIQNGVILLNPLKVKRIRYDSESCSYSQGLKVFLVYKKS